VADPHTMTPTTLRARPPRTRRAAPVVVAAMLLAGASALGVGSSEAQSELEEREQVQAEQAAAAADLETATAQDAELETALAALTDQVRTQEALVDRAEQAVTAAEAEVVAAENRVVEQQAEIDELRTEVQDTAVEAYIDPAQDVLSQVLASEDVSEAARREALMGNVLTRQQDQLDELAGIEEDLVIAEEDAELARTEVEEQRQVVTDELADLEATKAEQERVQAALDQRITDLQSEIDALEASEDELTAIINARASTSSGSSGGGGASGPGGSVDAPPSASGLIWPTSGPVTSPYGQRWGRLHAGIDIGAPTGNPIYASNSGTVIMGCGSGYGNCVLIDHGGGFITLYAHQSQVFVSDGQQVSRGQNIGLVGCTGSCTGPHLHYETRVNGSAQNPMNYLP
jgi:murein DD-endopeptidase MepM/ murein hydrolase activator NlpD